MYKLICRRGDYLPKGIIARTDPLMFFRNGTPIIMKLKCKEFKEDSVS